MHKLEAEIKPVRPFNHYKSHDLLINKKFTTANKYPDFLVNCETLLNKNWQKVVIEIGCGSGLHPIQWAKNNPNSLLIAIERTKNKFSAFKGRLASHKLNNIYPVNDDALYWLPSNITEVSTDEYLFLYPNPYPKEKQANKRWHRNPLFHYILKTLKPGGLITFASNELNYIQECELYCKNFWNLKLINKKELIDSENYLYRTHFEKKYLKSKQTCYDLIFQKTP